MAEIQGMLVAFYKQYDKRYNSTANPQYQVQGLRVDRFPIYGTLIEATDILNPVIEFYFDTTNPNTPDIRSIVSVLNYAYIEDFRRYYFVSNWVYDKGRWTAHFEIDVLGTYRDAFTLENEFYILRAADEENWLLPDALYPLTCEDKTIRTEMQVFPNGLWDTGGNVNNGYYICGIISSDTGDFGTVTYYVFTPSQMRQLVSQLMGSFSWLNFQDVSEELGKALINPFQYFTSCIWFPYPPQYRTVSRVKFGWWSFNVQAGIITEAAEAHVLGASCSLEKHPYDNNFDTFYNTTPFRQITIVAEPFGAFDINPPYNIENIQLFVNTDFITGVATLEVSRILSVSEGGQQTYDVIAYREAQLGVQVQLSQMTTNVLGVAENVVSAVGGAFDNLIRGQIGGAISNVASGVISAAEESVPKLSTKGANGSYLAYFTKPYMITRFRLPVSRDQKIFGAPLCKTDYIDSHKGFLQIASPSVKLTGATITEKRKVNEMFAQGFYYE